jgi:putative membrane protein insertion efficiency factor
MSCGSQRFNGATRDSVKNAAKSQPVLAAGWLRLTGSRFAVSGLDGGTGWSGDCVLLTKPTSIARQCDTETAVGDQHGHAHIAGPPRPGRNWPGPWRKTPGRLLGTSLVRLYQLTLSGFVGNSCRHLPTCSEYAHEAIARHGLWAGGWMGFFRVLRCGPFGTHGIDRVPEVLAERYVWFTPWRYWRIGSKRGEADK